MKLVVQSAEGKRAFKWESYALVRDNLQHFVEFGRPNGHFPALHGIEQAVDSGSFVADAARLRGEVLRAVAALRQIALVDAALSTRTRAIMTDSSSRPGAQPTMGARDVGWPLPLLPEADAGTTITEVASGFIDAILAVTEQAVDGQLVHIRRAGRGPRYATADPRPG